MIIKLNVHPDEAAKLQKILADEDFANALIAMQSPEEVQAALSAKNVNLSIDEIMDIAVALNNAGKEEISEAELENVSGGVAGVNIYWDYKKGKLNITVIW